MSEDVVRSNTTTLPKPVPHGRERRRRAVDRPE